MTEDEKQKLIASLQQEAELIKTELLTFAKPDLSNPGNYIVSVEENDRDQEGNASDITELETKTALKDNLLRRLNEINLALRRIESGEYGKCEPCSAPIQPSRLKVMPVARICIDCAKKANLRES